MNKVLVTGGLGYIGSHTVVELINAGYEVEIIDNLVNSKRSTLTALETITKKEIKLYEIDIEELSSLEERVFKTSEYFAIIHFAALKSVSESISNPLKYYKTNVIGTINLIDLCAKYQVNRFIFSSSACIYGNEANKVNNEQREDLNPINPYGKTKLMVEKILEEVCGKNNNLQGLSLRYFNPVGSHDSYLIGENPLNEPTNLFPIIERVATGQKEKLQIFGKDYNTKDGTAVRDYVHVVDIARGHVVALNAFKNNKSYDVYNMGTEKGYTVLETVLMYEKINGIKLNYEFTERRDGDAEDLISDCTKIRNELGWKAEKTLEEMCRDSYNWRRSLMSK